MTGYNKKYGAYMTKEDKRQDIIKGMKMFLEVGAFDQYSLREKILLREYGMTEEEIEKEIYS